MFDIDEITRPNIRKLTPYSSARSEFKGDAKNFLDANESPIETTYNRYPDPLQKELKDSLSCIKGINKECIFVGNGSDEVIDLLFRAFCNPSRDKAYIFPPTYGMYEVSAQINDVAIVRIPLTVEFELPGMDNILSKIDSKGLLFICNPNNPTGNTFKLSSIQRIAESFSGLVIVDEAYIDFCSSESAITLLDSMPNLVVLQTMSKAFGLAGLRVGMAYASPEIVNILNKIKPPYNVNVLSQQLAVSRLSSIDLVKKEVENIMREREKLIVALEGIDEIQKVYRTEANFILIKIEDANAIYYKLTEWGMIIRNISSKIQDCLRITVGTSEENKILIGQLKSLLKSEKSE